MIYNLFVDDYRNPEDVTMCLGEDWRLVRSLDEAVRLVEREGKPDLISFDHDLNDKHYSGDYSDNKTGADLAYVLCKMFNGSMPRYQIHSLNPDAPIRIREAIKVGIMELETS